MADNTDGAGERPEDEQLTPARLREIAGRAETLKAEIDTVFRQLDDVAELLGPVSVAQARAMLDQSGRDAGDMAESIAYLADRLAGVRARSSGPV